MCGIAGVVLSDGAPVDEATIRAMTRAIEHRGPDGEGVFVAPGVGLGHRRLSILDLTENASQPMAHAHDGTALVFNGEIYNFADLRNDLLAAGETLISTGDTEALYHWLRREGVRAVQRAQGMFAFAFWDGRKRELILARDRFGKKPVYYAPFGPGGREGLAFASELRALLAHPRVRAERAVDHTALGQYLLHEFVPAPRSILANVRKLMPGETLRWRDGAGFSLETYYSPRFERSTSGDPRAMVSEFTRLVEQATRDRLVADVPVGLFLSGGLDSSLIAALAVRSHPRVKTFSVAFEDPTFDESSHARVVARHLGTEHTEERLSPGVMIDLVPSTLDWLDEPLADTSMLPTTLLARIARRQVTVALSGDGGDEILAGYPTFVVDGAIGWMPAMPDAFARAGRWVADRVPPSDANFSLGFKLRQFAGGINARGARRHARWLASILPEESRALLGPSIPSAALDGVYGAADRAEIGTDDEFGAATAYYLRVYLGEGVLTKVDRATMRASLEARAPLLDTRVVEYCLSLPTNVRLRGRVTKWLMRQALAPLVPASIVAREKKGFGAPVGQWLRGPLLPLLRDTLSPSRLRESGWFDPARVGAMIDAHAAGREDLRKPLWSLLVLEHWRQRWFA